MQISELTVSVSDTDGQRRFYGGLLGLPLRELKEGGFEVTVGWSRLRFVPGGRPPGHVEHIALLFPKARWDAAQGWLEVRTPLLADAQGETRFSGNWDAGQLYFKDTDGNIMELIGYDRWPAARAGDFGPDELLGIAEFGLTLDDPETGAARLAERLGQPERSPQDPEFMWLGGPEGRLILSRRGRIWFPDTGIPSTPGPFALTLAQGERTHSLGHHDLPASSQEAS